MAPVIPEAAVVALSETKIFAGVLMLFGYLLTGYVHEPNEGISPDVRNDFIVALNRLSECGNANEGMPSGKFHASVAKERILGGNDAREGGWPWMVYLFLQRSGSVDGFICGGTLIDSRWMVTAAHCIQLPNSPEEYGVILGEHRVSDISVNERKFNVTRVIRHEDFNPILLNQDIALIKLSEPVLFTNHVRPICLPPLDYPTDATSPQMFHGQPTSYAGKKCIVAGWGQTDNKLKSDVLQQLDVIIFPRVICSAITESLDSSSYASPISENSTKFCAYAGDGQDTCNGDSGGPLMCLNEDDGRYYLHGITSYGPDPCGQRNLPAVYTKVADFRDWIEEKTK